LTALGMVINNLTDGKVKHRGAELWSLIEHTMNDQPSLTMLLFISWSGKPYSLPWQ
jgi:hypothetical protein